MTEEGKLKLKIIYLHNVHLIKIGLLRLFRSYIRADDVSMGEDVPELLRGCEKEAAGEAGFWELVV